MIDRRVAMGAMVLGALGGACAHTVGAPEVATRAVVGFDCDVDHVYVHELARNHYAAAGCGKRAVFICRSGACERDEELRDVRTEEPLVADGRRAHEALASKTASVLACAEEEEYVVDVVFATDGEGSYDHRMRSAISSANCFNAAFYMIRLDPPPEYPLYVRHTFSRTAWAPFEGPAPAAVPTAGSEEPPAEEAEEQTEEEPAAVEPSDAPDRPPVRTEF